MPIHLFLASQSPRRRELLRQIGREFDVLDVDVPERREPNETPEDYVSRVAREKAGAGLMSGGVSGLMNFGKQQAVSNATTAVAYNIDKTFHVRVRLSVQTNYNGQPGTRFVARGTPYKARDRDSSLKFKRARYSSYKMMRSR